VKTSVVVVSYRPGDWLAPCLASVSAQADEVVLVDNGSEDKSASRIGIGAGTRVLRSEVNQGFAPAVNAGVRACRGEAVALLNDDAVAGPGWLSSATAALSDESVAAVGPKLLLSARFREIRFPDEEWYAPGDERPLGRQIRSVTVNGAELIEAASGPGLHRVERDIRRDRWRWTAGRRPWYVPLPEGSRDDEVLVDGEPAPPGPVVRLVNSAGTFLDMRGYGGDIGADTPDDGRFDEATPRFGISGSAFVMRKEVWRELGPFAGRFFAYYEDIDWCWRANLRGKQVLYDPAATVEHHRSASSGGEHEPWVRVISERNRTLTMVRNGPARVLAKSLRDRFESGPDGGVRSGITRLLPWALASRAALSRRWAIKPEAVWERWAGQSAEGSAIPGWATKETKYGAG
jgi:N-acetylglucosaminyl-diphospho-decaprenol L-rhamnosyltransferase